MATNGVGERLAQDILNAQLEDIIAVLDQAVGNERLLRNSPDFGGPICEGLLGRIIDTLSSPDDARIDKARILRALPYTGREVAWMMGVMSETGTNISNFGPAMQERGVLGMAERLRPWMISNPEGPYDGQAAELAVYLRGVTEGAG